MNNYRQHSSQVEDFTTENFRLRQLLKELRESAIKEAIENSRLRKSKERLLLIGKEAVILLNDMAKEFDVDVKNSPAIKKILITILEEESADHEKTTI